MHIARWTSARAFMAPDGPGTGGTGSNTDLPPDIEEARRRIAKALKDGSSELNLDDLRLRDLPEELFQLAELERLHLAKNKLETLDPRVFTAFARLRFLDLTSNRLKALPTEIASAQALEEL